MVTYFTTPHRWLASLGILTIACGLTPLATAQAATQEAALFAQTTLVTPWSLSPRDGLTVRLGDPIMASAITAQGPQIADATPVQVSLSVEPTTPMAAPPVPAVYTVEGDRSDSVKPNVETKRQRTPPDIKRLEIAYHVLNAADVATTLVCLNRSNCEERNPIFGRNPKTAVIIGAKALTSAVHYWAMRRLVPENPGLARAFGYVAVIVQGGVVGFNLTQLF